MLTIIYVAKNQSELLKVAKKCLTKNISFEFMNDKEMYFNIFDELDFEFKQAVLGAEIINRKNVAN